MKKIIILLLISIFLLTGCMSKNLISSSKFIEVLENNGYTITSTIEMYQTEQNYKEVLTAVHPTEFYQIDFYEFDSLDTATQIYEKYKKRIYDTIEEGSTTDISALNYDKYEQSSDTHYGVVVRVDNTLIYSLVTIEYKEEIKSILKDLGY